MKVGHVLPAADGSIEPVGDSVGETEQDQVKVGSRRGLPETMPVCVMLECDSVWVGSWFVVRAENWNMAIIHWTMCQMYKLWHSF